MNLTVGAERGISTMFQTRQFTIRSRQSENIPEQGLRLDMPAAGDYDTVSIQNRETLDDDKFASVLSKSAVEALKNGIPASRTSELHQQVQSGQYIPVSSRIAERMLGYRI